MQNLIIATSRRGLYQYSHIKHYNRPTGGAFQERKVANPRQDYICLLVKACRAPMEAYCMMPTGLR
jgi:hypothetical protein